MPLFKHRTAIEIARGVRAFLGLEIGLTRGEVPDPERLLEIRARQLRRVRKQIDRQAREIERLREVLVKDRPTGIVQSIIDSFSKAKEDVYFVQVGACDGTTLDPIHHFVERDGWSGILVEPVGYVFERLVENYRGNKNLVFENAAVSEEDGTRDFYYVRESDDLPIWYDQLGSFLPQVVRKHSERIPKLESRVVEERVRCVTFETLARKHEVEKIDLLHTDTEGYDFKLIKRFDFDRFDPSIVLYEHKHLEEADKEACRSLLESKGYKTIQEDQDTIAFKEGFNAPTDGA